MKQNASCKEKALQIKQLLIETAKCLTHSQVGLDWFAKIAASSSSLRASRRRRLASTCDSADLAESWSSQNSPTGWLVLPWFIMVGIGKSMVIMSEYTSGAREMREPGVTRAGCCNEVLPVVYLLLKCFSRLVIVSSPFCIAAWVSITSWSNALICISAVLKLQARFARQHWQS